ncbi:D-alanyl-D-alanine carboxypeptidase [Streptomyces scabiei]|uniref:D-alanyl-D-alanine carboxypeptidase n=1 Tax=Streptomyces scabiei TaxID=1930 RepID=UPI0029BD5AF6|nr:D-alanyl-D-alanine carboxypeptidase [Streptomyces scabiei]MDX3522232.1 D-alanyl-D-alanine carboxypeptidase [Streptomyces scabiei]
MAGTSPDRSKRYESSTESTPGNEPPVRDTPGPAKPSPDPRLAMSRDAAPKPDQATAVFSRRSLAETTEAGPGRDADEADAAAAVPGDGGPETGGSGADAGADGPGAGPSGADAGSGDSDAGPSGAGRSGADADTGADGSDAGPSGADGSDAGPSGADAGSDGSGAGSSESSDADTDTDEDRDGDEDRDADAGDGGGVGDRLVDAGSDTDASRPASDAASESPSDDASSDAASADGEGSGDAVKAPHGSAEAPADSDEAEDGQGGGEGHREETPEDGPAAGAGDGDGGARTTADEPEAADEALKAEPGADHDDTGSRERDADAPAPAPAPGASAVRLPGARAGEESDRAAAAGTDADAEGETDADAGTGAGVTHEADAAPRAPRSGTDSRTTTLRVPAAAARTEPEDAVVAGAVDDAHPEDARPAAADEVEDRSSDVPPATDSTVHLSADARPGAVADDDEPDAADDESRAGGKPEGEGEGGGGGGGAAEAKQAVDQPTAIFRAPRPPAVDQPTTMLKLGGAAAPRTSEPADQADADADAEPAGTDRAGTADAEPAGKALADPPAPSERTSKFVALKPLDEHAPAKPPAAAPHGPAVTPAEATRAIPQVGPERTTQQPLPPKPPLDLLAELTNTPPPRQTPVRTFIRRVKIWTPLAILLVIVFAVAQSLRPLPAPALALTADESYAFKGGKVDLPWPAEGQGWMDVNGIGTMDSFGEQKPVAIGSVAKAMTAYVILKDHPMKPGEKGETITVDAKGETEGGYDKDGESTLNTVKEGDELSQYDAIAAIMIPSANNIARLLARWDSKGSEEAFVKKMNAAAKDLGMKNTTYTDPSGLKETTVSTAEDQVKLGNALVKMKALTDITKLPTWVDPSGKEWDNYNRLVPYNNAIGIKTGSTTAAGGNLLFAATQEVGGETAIVVGAVLGQHTPPIIDTVNAVSKTAMLAAQDALTSATILKKGDVVGHVDDGLGGRTPVVVTKNVSAVGWAGKTVKLELDASASIPHEAKPGTVVGSLIVGNGAGDGVEVPVALRETLTEPGFLTKLTRVS